MKHETVPLRGPHTTKECDEKEIEHRGSSLDITTIIGYKSPMPCMIEYALLPLCLSLENSFHDEISSGVHCVGQLMVY